MVIGHASPLAGQQSSVIAFLEVIIILAAIASGIIHLFSWADKDSGARETAISYITISDAMNKLYEQRLSYGAPSDNLERTLIASGGLPKDMVFLNGIVTRYGRINVLVTPTDARRFDVIYRSGSLPSAVCSKFIPKLLAFTGSITLGGTAVTTPESAESACATTGEEGNATGDLIITSEQLPGADKKL